jgi:hypothetical protein
MAKYVSSKLGATASTSANAPDLLVAAAATGAGSLLALHEISLSGEAASSTFVRFVLNRPSAVTVGGGPTSQVAQPVNPGSVAASYTVYTALAAGAITPGGVNLLVPAFNAFGGVYTWLAAPKGELIVGGQGTSVPSQNLLFYSLSGTPVYSGHFIIEEL